MINSRCLPHRRQPLHYSRIRSFKIPTIPSPITTSLHNKTSLNIIFTQFCTLLSHQNAHQNKIHSLNTTTNFCVASAEAETTTVWDQYFCRSLILRMAIFFLFCRTNFCDWGNCLFFLGINVCDFPEAAFYLEL